MLILIGVLGCGEKSSEDTAFVTETADEVVDTDTDADTDTGEPVDVFIPNEGHWTYSGGELIPSGTTCQLDETTEGELTDPVGFNLTIQTGGFLVQSDDPSDNGVTCLMAENDDSGMGSYTCGGSLVEEWFEKVFEDDFGNDMDIKMSIETAISGTFSSASTLTNTFTLTLECLEVDYAIPLSCNDVDSQFPTPCTIQFTANASLD
jgi:hypothetical protein